MSARAVKNGGARFTHNFIDDLESFYWLLVWSVAMHLDSKDQNTSGGASETLRKLTDERMYFIDTVKMIVLYECSREGRFGLRKKLLSFENSWATKPSVMQLIFDMGNYFMSRVYLGTASAQDPRVVFPKIVDMIMVAIVV